MRKEVEQEYLSDTVISIEPEIPVNSDFPFGPHGLSSVKNSIFFPPDPKNYGGTLPIDGNSIDSISYYFGIKNESSSISKPRINELEFISLDDDTLNYYFDTVAYHSVDSCKFRLPNMGIYECYYFVMKTLKSSYGIYGNLLLRDTLTTNGKLINIFYEYGGDQNVSLKYFYISNKVINIYRGSAYDDGTFLRKKYRITISDDGRIDVNRTESLTD